jgi:hypothetical protein
MSQTITETMLQPTEPVPPSTEEEDEAWAEYKMIRQTSAEVEREFWHLEQKRRELRRSLSDVRKKLWSVCDHDWEREPPMYQERTWHTCRKCGNMK